MYHTDWVEGTKGGDRKALHCNGIHYNSWQNTTNVDKAPNVKDYVGSIGQFEFSSLLSGTFCLVFSFVCGCWCKYWKNIKAPSVCHATSLGQEHKSVTVAISESHRKNILVISYVFSRLSVVDPSSSVIPDGIDPPGTSVTPLKCYTSEMLHMYF